MSQSSESISDLSSEASPAQTGGGAPSAAPGLRRLFAVAVFAAILGLGIALSFGYADHAPRPHGVRIAVAAPPAVRAHVAAGLERAQPGSFDVVAVASAQAAARTVRSQSTAGALIVPASGPTTIVTAGAEGLTQKQALTKALAAASAAMHRSAQGLDGAALPPGPCFAMSSLSAKAASTPCVTSFAASSQPRCSRSSAPDRSSVMNPLRRLRRALAASTCSRGGFDEDPSGVGRCGAGSFTLTAERWRVVCRSRGDVSGGVA